MKYDQNSQSELIRPDVALPPGIDAPSPPAEVERIARGRVASLAEVEGDLRALAERAGGIHRLRELVTELEQAER